ISMRTISSSTAIAWSASTCRSSAHLLQPPMDRPDYPYDGGSHDDQEAALRSSAASTAALGVCLGSEVLGGHLDPAIHDAGPGPGLLLSPQRLRRRRAARHQSERAEGRYREA